MKSPSPSESDQLSATLTDDEALELALLLAIIDRRRAELEITERRAAA